jgi:hypothetical protein
VRHDQGLLKERIPRLGRDPGEPQGSVTIVALFVLAALGASLLIGGLFRHFWAQSEQRTIEKKWQERERLLGSRIIEWRPRPAGTREVAQAETVARVLYIVARDQPELFAFLRQDFAAEEADAVIEILMDRRQGARPCEADGRDPRRNGTVSVDLREVGFAFVRQQASLPINHSKVRPPSDSGSLASRPS